MATDLSNTSKPESHDSGIMKQLRTNNMGEDMIRVAHFTGDGKEKTINLYDRKKRHDQQGIYNPYRIQIR